MTRPALLSLIALVLTLSPAVTRASSPYLVTLPDEALAQSAAHRYANMSTEEALEELDRRAVPYDLLAPVDGVRTPVRLTGPLHGVSVHSALPQEQRPSSPFEILDARLALALDDFCALLERHDIVELVHYTIYRPNAPPPTSRTSLRAVKVKARTLGKGTLVSKRRPIAEPRGTKKKTVRKKGIAASKRVKRERRRATKEKPVDKLKWAAPGTRHPAGLAIDVGAFRKRDGSWLLIGHHFQGHIGAQTCGPAVEPPDAPQARELRAIVCEAYDLGLFTYVLTPNYDRAHADHFHMEIRGDVPWVLYN